MRFHFTESKPSDVRFAVLSSRMGSVVVGETPIGVCWLAFVGQEAEAQRSLVAMFPHAKLTRHDETPAIQQIRAFLNGERRTFDLTVDMAGTSFQRLVWRELCTIRYGETTTYSALAASLGRPQAVRAVARACATNPVSLIVPCHRVVRMDGNLAGYRWDVARKRQLLELEQNG